jgi:hypothetical protein
MSEAQSLALRRRLLLMSCCWMASHSSCFPPPRSGGEGSRVGGGAANATVSEFADRPPTPDPSPPRADARGGRGEDTPSHSRGVKRPSDAKNFRPLFRGRRECRAPGAPAAARAKVESKKAHALVRSHRKHPAFPAQWFYDLFRALPGDRALLPPSLLRSLLLKNLTPASRRQDHTTSPSASSALVRSTIRVHRIPPHVRDDRETPLQGGGTGESILLFLPRRQSKFGNSERNGLSASKAAFFLDPRFFRKRVRAAVVSSCPQRYEYLTDWKTLHTFVWLTIVLAKAEGDQMTPPAKVAAVTAAAMFGH